MWLTMRRVQLLAFLGAVLLARAEELPDCESDLNQCVDLHTCSAPTERVLAPHNVVFLWGNTGSGKSTLAKYLSHHDADMMSVLKDNTYVIEGVHIGSSPKSVTKIPEIMTDNVTTTHYVDCPGFEDTRGSCAEVSTTFYMRDLTRQIRQAKVLLLTPYYSVTRGKDRTSFLTMILHAAKIMRAGMEESLALVVTKVDAVVKRGKQYAPIDTSEAKKSVASFLQEEMRPFLSFMAGDSENADGEVYKRAAELVDILLIQAERDFSRIAIFRAPNEEGLVSDVEIMENCRSELLELIGDNLKYANVEPGDFRFPVSDRTKLFAIARAQNLSDAIAVKLSALASRMQASHSKSSYSPDVPTAAELWQRAAADVRSLASELSNSSSVQDFCSRLSNRTVNMPERSLAVFVASDCRYLDVMQVVSDQPFVDESTLHQWTQPIYAAAEHLNDRGNWNRFLISLYDRLNKYDEQVCSMLQRLRASHNKTFPLLSEANLPLFEKETSRLGVFMKMVENIANVTDLNQLLELATRAPVYECVGSVLIVRGESLLMSEAAQSSRCGGVSRIEIYALNTLFLDVDVVMPGIELAMVAYRLEVVGTPKIDLDGKAGNNSPMKLDEAPVGERGADGEAGEPGHPGGHFFGVAFEITGHLRVSASGGRGGRGQDGGPGGVGRSGGGDGGDGGDGGVRGFGGPAGTILVRALSGQPGNIPEITAERGLMGEGGRGGLGGDYRPHTAIGRRRKRAGWEVLGILALLAIAYKAHKNSNSPPPPEYVSGRAGKFAVAGVPNYLQATNPNWIDVHKRAYIYFEHNVNHAYRHKELKQFLLQFEEEFPYTRIDFV